MRSLQIFLLVASFPCLLHAQYPFPPSQSDFTSIQAFLSSDLMEGRETGERGSFLASEYIASMMQLNGLHPFGDPLPAENDLSYPDGNRSWFQTFSLIRYGVENATMTLAGIMMTGDSVTNWTLGSDFGIDPVIDRLEVEAQLVFAGYGITVKTAGYDDYQGIDATGKIVVILSGFPGHRDTLSPAWKRLKKDRTVPDVLRKEKLTLAKANGAVAVIEIDLHQPFNPAASGDRYARSLWAKTIAVDTVHPVYTDPEYCLPASADRPQIACLNPSQAVSEALLNLLPFTTGEFENRSSKLESSAVPISGKKIKLSVLVKKDTVVAKNVVGIFQGRDTSRYVLVGAHYDHLGKRKELIYHGADDNASGTAGMLALSAKWAGYEQKPACNIVFAAWIAEEKGVLGSAYFAADSRMSSLKLSLVINMDMISRCDKEDSLRNVISIGTLPASEDLRAIARKSNDRLPQPFALDLWDVTGHCGSDYCHFASRNIPVMTFFSGFHADYHSPRDIFSKTDPGRMEKILSIVNECICEGVGK